MPKIVTWPFAQRPRPRPYEASQSVPSGSQYIALIVASGSFARGMYSEKRSFAKRITPEEVKSSSEPSGLHAILWIRVFDKPFSGP
jgi:hypothetical protein